MTEKQSPILNYGLPSLARRGYSALEAICPFTGKPWDILLSNNLMDYWAKQPGRARELAFVIPHCLKKPHRMFKGVRDLRNDVVEDSWLCYCCRPDVAYNYRTGEKVAPWPGKTVVVYITDERHLYNWYWVEADTKNRHLPIDHSDRFGEPVP